MDTIIALDLETTGVDPSNDAIIEIGAVRFRGKRVEDEFQTFIHPGCAIPPLITQLTGITDDMVAEAPRIQDVLPDLETFLGDFPMLGHNVGFDREFLHQAAMRHDRPALVAENQLIDTMDLASVLLPSANRYGLSALALSLGIPVENAHRALEDAQTTRNVFLRLFDSVLELDPSLINTICRLGQRIAWGGGWFFEAALEALYDKGIEPEGIFHPTFPPLDQTFPPLEPVEERSPLDAEELAALLEPGGAFSKSHDAYEHRIQQIRMLEAVADAFSGSQHLLVEAGTGIGKSMAYLIPSFAWAEENGERVVISTNTINLQDQLSLKDIPALRRATGKPLPAAVLKGRNNYLCPRRLNAMLSLGPRSPQEMRVLAKLLVWLHQGGSGDRSEINLAYGEPQFWVKVSAEGEDCSPERCRTLVEGRCPYFQARRAAESAQVIIVNHALLLADVATGSRVLPEYNYLIVDEAHHLEAATTNGLSIRIREAEFLALIRELGNERSGLLRQVLSSGRHSLTPSQLGQLQTQVSSLAGVRDRAIELGRELFQALKMFIEGRDAFQAESPYAQRVRIEPSTRTLPDWSTVEIAWDELREPLQRTLTGLARLVELLTDMHAAGLEDMESPAIAAQSLHRELESLFTQLDQLLFDPDPGHIYWLELKPGSPQVMLHSAPLHVGPLVQQYLWHQKESIIMTSATLTAAGEFDYIRNRLSAEDADELSLGSPFDYETSTLLYLVKDIAEPSDRHTYQQGVEKCLQALCRATQGRTLALFTSYAQLRRTADRIQPALQKAGIRLLTQESGASRHALLQAFREEERAVLLGTRSFWEGVDIPGKALSVLVIVRLPFHVPNDPVIAARAETFEFPFDQYMVPEAILRFRQGFGRLIRTQSDRGVVVILDKRVLSKRYGGSFITSLPQCVLREGTMSELPGHAARWLGL